MVMLKEKPSVCPGVITTECTRDAPNRRDYTFTDGKRSLKGFIALKHSDTRGDIWQPYIQSSTRAGWWNAGPMDRFISGYKNFDEAWSILLKEAARMLGGTR